MGGGEDFCYNTSSIFLYGQFVALVTQILGLVNYCPLQPLFWQTNIPRFRSRNSCTPKKSNGIKSNGIVFDFCALDMTLFLLSLFLSPPQNCLLNDNLSRGSISTIAWRYSSRNDGRFLRSFAGPNRERSRGWI